MLFLWPLLFLWDSFATMSRRTQPRLIVYVEDFAVSRNMISKFLGSKQTVRVPCWFSRISLGSFLSFSSFHKSDLLGSAGTYSAHSSAWNRWLFLMWFSCVGFIRRVLLLLLSMCWRRVLLHLQLILLSTTQLDHASFPPPLSHVQGCPWASWL